MAIAKPAPSSTMVATAGITSYTVAQGPELAVKNKLHQKQSAGPFYSQMMSI